MLGNTPAEAPTADTPIQGRFVTLEGLSEERHVADLWHHYSVDDSTWKWLPGTMPSSKAGLWADCEEIMRDNIVFAVVGDPNHLDHPHSHTDEGRRREALGLIIYGDVNTRHRTLEAGAIFGPAIRQTAAAAEAHYLLFRNVFEAQRGPSYRWMSWKTSSLNVASGRAAQRLGYVHEGTWRNHTILSGGRSRDAVWYSVTDDDWPVIKAALERWLDAKNFREDGSQVDRLEDIRQSLKQNDTS